MTKNNLIGYDPLAWMDGADIEEDTPPVEPVKKVTKSRAKAKVLPAEVIEEPVVQEPVVEIEDELIVVDKLITIEKLTDDEELVIVDELVTVEETAEDEEELVIVDELVTIEDSPVEESDDIEIDVSIDKDGEIEISVETDKNTEVNVHVSIETTEKSTDENNAIEVVSEKVIDETFIPTPPEPHIDLNSEASIKTIAVLYEKLKHILDAHDRIEINASDVTSIDTATLQLLVSLKKDAPRLGKTIDIIYPSERFVESAQLLGLLAVLEISTH